MKTRVHSIDVVRGIVMIIMALDHCRDLLHFSSLFLNPTDLSQTTPGLFAARWITHLCAPTFVFLSGVSVYLSMQRSENSSSLAAFLRMRGLWLILLEITVVNFAIWFDVHFRLVMIQVIGAIGFGFILLSFLLKVAPKKIGIAALIIIALHNLLQLVSLPANPAVAAVFNILVAPGLLSVSPSFSILISYPIIQWTAIMLLGFAVGQIFTQERTRMNARLLRYGLVSLLVFVLLRFVNLYGDPAPWQSQKSTLFNIFSFFNVTKYPPSLQYTLLFLGIAFLLLRFANNLPSVVRKVLIIYGQVPMFYYLLHFYLIRLATFIMVFAQGFSYKDLLFGPFQFGRPAHSSGVGLMAVVAIWLLIVALLYPLCKWYGTYKRNHPEKDWLRYL